MCFSQRKTSDFFPIYVKMSIKNKFKQIGIFVIAYNLIQALKQYFRFKPITFLRDLFNFISDYIKLKNDLKNSNFQFYIKDFLPCLQDKTTNTPLDPVYFYQDSWAASKIFQNPPLEHFDIGSAAKTIGIISQFVPTTMIDIRPIALKLPNLKFIKGSILNLPFENNSIKSISSLCVIEHIGLGRYGDSIDAFGSEKSIKELIRVTAKNGFILFSVPINDANKIYFNAHRAFTREFILEQFYDCELIEERYIYKNDMVNMYIKENGYGIGLYQFKKI